MLNECIMKKNNTVKEAIDVLEKLNVKSVFIVGENNYLEGIFTRGDLRRFTLEDGDLNAKLEVAMNPSPLTFFSADDARLYSHNKRRVVYPIVNREHQLIDVLYNKYDVISDEMASHALENVPVVIMAGGLGTRLYPLTKVLPKALIPIGEYTITERIIHNFVAWGCREFYLVLNHKADMIKSYFNDISKDYTIHFVKEEKFLGTGGGLSLLRDDLKTTFILSNCDILVNADFDCIMKTHKSSDNLMTFIGALKNVSIPYGVIETKADGQVTLLKEKPELSFLTNTGVYVIEPQVIKELDDEKFIHITDIAKEIMEREKRVGVFPITEKSWLDMGQFSEMSEMMKALGIEE